MLCRSTVLRRSRVEHRLALGPVAEELRRAAPGSARWPRRLAATPRGARFSGIMRPANTTSGSAGRTTGASSDPAYSPSSTVTSPRRPSSRRRRACSAEKQNARWGRRAHRRCTRDPIAPPMRAEVLAPVAPAPDLVPVDHQPIAARAAARRRPPAARSRGRRRCAPRRSGGRGAAGARARPARTRAAAGSAAVRLSCRAPCRGPAVTTRTRSSISTRSPRSHWRSVR